MSLTFLHTAEWQLWKLFASIEEPSKRHRVQQERLHAVQGLKEVVEKSSASFVLVAGDLFDSSQATKATASAAYAAIGSLKIPVLAIPGNHDHAGPGSIWEHEFFKREQQQLAPNLRVLLTPEPVVLENAIIFPAPLLRRHDAGDPTAWIRAEPEGPSLPPEFRKTWGRYQMQHAFCGYRATIRYTVEVSQSFSSVLRCCPGQFFDYFKGESTVQPTAQ